MKILLIDNYDSFTYNIVDLLKQLNIDDVTIFKNDEITIEEACLFDKIIISPGPATPIESGNILPIIQSLGATHSILGICLGHQAIAEAYGGQLINLENPYHGYITQLMDIKPHRIFDHIQSTEVGLYHSWIVDAESLPTELEISSYSSDGYIMSIKHKTHDVHGVQFHPESYMTPDGKRMIENFFNG